MELKIVNESKNIKVIIYDGQKEILDVLENLNVETKKQVFKY